MARNDVDVVIVSALVLAAVLVDVVLIGTAAIAIVVTVGAEIGADVEEGYAVVGGMSGCGGDV